MLIKINGCSEDFVLNKLGGRADMLGYDFFAESDNYVPLITSRAGIIPDYSADFYKQTVSGEEAVARQTRPAPVGIFENNMMQEVVTRIYNHHLQYVELQGAETADFIDNLRRTVVPDIQPTLKIIKKMPIPSVSGALQVAPEDAMPADVYIFQLDKTIGADAAKELIGSYKGRTPYLLNVHLDEAAASLLTAVADDERFLGFDLDVDESQAASAELLSRLCQARS